MFFERDENSDGRSDQRRSHTDCTRRYRCTRRNRHAIPAWR
jgi:hypothetical protein